MLKDFLIKTISEKGAISFYEYMRFCQEHPEYGYYTAKPYDEILGAKGDFVTSPEISSLFGEIIAFWVVSLWERLGKPAILNLLELGAGRGVLMRDILITLTKLKSFTATCNVHLLEINPSFRQIQTEKLNGLCELQHHASLDFLNEIETPIIMIANEFLIRSLFISILKKMIVGMKSMLELMIQMRCSLSMFPMKEFLSIQKYNQILS